MLDLRKLKIKWKIILPYSLLIFFLMGAMLAWYIISLSRYMADQQLKKVDIVIRAMAEALSFPLSILDYDGLNKSLKHLQGTDEDICYIVLQGKNARTIASVGTPFTNQTLPIKKILQTKDLPSGVRLIKTTKDVSGHEMSYPIKLFDVELGTLFIGVSTAKTSKIINTFIIINLIVGIGAILIGIFIFIGFIQSRVTKPIQELIEVSNKISSGNFEKRIQYSSQDELGELAESFNKMASQLQQLLVKLSQQNQELERQINERRQAEEKIRHSSALLKSLIDSIPDLIFYKDKDSVYLGCNKAFSIFAGAEEKEVIGKTDYDFFPLELAEFFRDKDRTMLREAEPRRNEEWVTYPDGKEVLLDTLKTPYYDLDGNILGLIGVSRDITGQRQVEIEKRKMEEQLQRAEKMEALGILAGGVAHDLNNVLGIVVGYAELILSDIDDSNPIRASLVNIMEGGQRAAAIVQDLLTLARRGISGRKAINLNKIIVDYQNSPEFKNLSSHSSIMIKTDLEPNLLNISGSTVHLSKTLLNLVLNANEAMPKGGTLTIKTSNQYLDRPIQGYDEVREGDYVVLSISDTGEGISVSDLKRIFEPFYSKKVMGRSGTGLGLAVVWGTVKDHQSYINVQSEEGKGSTFTLYFPVTREEISAADVAVPLAEYLGKGETILIIDDVKGQLDLAEKMLKKLNYQVTSASSGEEAVAYLKGHTVDLLVLDMIMDPGMDGLDTYQKILEVHPGQKAIIVSGFSETERVYSAQALGAGAYVKKPYVIEKLGLAVRKELDRTM